MRYLMAILLAAFLATPAFAAFTGPGSAPQAANIQTSTVAQALQLADKTRVVLEGNIISKVNGSKDNYMFKDATGEIMVDIDHDKFMGRDVTPANTVRIMGKVDKDPGKPVEIDVKNFEVLK